MSDPCLECQGTGLIYDRQLDGTVETDSCPPCAGVGEKLDSGIRLLLYQSFEQGRNA